MQPIAVDTDQLLQTTQKLAQQLAETKQELKQLYEAVEHLNTMWTGPANRSFRSQFAADQQAAYDLCDVLRQYIQAMAYAGNAYGACEQKVGGLVKSIRI